MVGNDRRRITVSGHARERAQQRGITEAQAAAVVEWGDLVVRRGQGMIAVMISKRRLRSLSQADLEGVDPDRLRGLVVLVKDDVCITTLRNRRTVYTRRVS